MIKYKLEFLNTPHELKEFHLKYPHNKNYIDELFYDEGINLLIEPKKGMYLELSSFIRAHNLVPEFEMNILDHIYVKVKNIIMFEDKIVLEVK